MSLLTIFGIALALAMDAFAVSIGVSTSRTGLFPAQIFRLTLFFGLFQFLMSMLGWAVGRNVMTYIRSLDHWIAFGLLTLIALHMIFESFKADSIGEKRRKDSTRGLSLFMLSVATSIDALAVGLSFAALDVSILFPAVLIGIVAALMTLLGTKLGPLAGRAFGKRAELLGGVILIFIGLKILIEHLT